MRAPALPPTPYLFRVRFRAASLPRVVLWSVQRPTSGATFHSVTSKRVLTNAEHRPYERTGGTRRAHGVVYQPQSATINQGRRTHGPSEGWAPLLCGAVRFASFRDSYDRDALASHSGRPQCGTSTLRGCPLCKRAQTLL